MSTTTPAALIESAAAELPDMIAAGDYSHAPAGSTHTIYLWDKNHESYRAQFAELQYAWGQWIFTYHDGEFTGSLTSTDPERIHTAIGRWAWRACWLNSDGLIPGI